MRNKVLVIYFCLSFFSLTSIATLRAEGSKELTPNFGDNGQVHIEASSSDFATYSTTTDSLYRLNITVCNLGERIYFGFRPSESDIYMRIKDPNDNIVYGPILLPQGTAGPGRIDNYTQAVAGPNVINAAGYNPLFLDPTMTGDYYIEFNDGHSTNYSTGDFNFTYFDITVVDTTGAFTAKTGRLWAREWQITCNSFTNPFLGTMYVYANDGIVTNIQFNGIMPYLFTIAANSTGTQNTGNVAVDRQSRVGNVNFPDYRIFLNDPDSTCYPTGIYGGLTSSSTLTGCSAASRCLNVFVDKDGRVDVVIDLNGVAGYQAGTEDVLLTSNVTVGTNCIPWDGLDGLGNRLTGGITVPIDVQYQNGITHLPLYDVENHPGGYIVQLVRPQNGLQPQLFWDDNNVGGTLELTGCSNPGGCHTWGDGSGNTNTIGNVNTINTWWIANVISDSVTLDFNDIVVDANNSNGSITGNNDTSICDNAPVVQLNGAVSGTATTGEWSSVNGNNFSPSTTDLNATYTFSAADISAGEAILVLTSTNNGVCNAVSDTMRITIPAGPIASAGGNQSVCENNPNVQLNASISNIGSATWSGGIGNFNPNNTTLNALYTPDATEVAAGSMKLYLTTATTGSSGSITVSTSDDAEEVNGSMSLTSNDLDMAESGGDENFIGMRFQNITIPQDATITASYIQFKSDDNESGTVNFMLFGEAIDDSPAFASVPSNITSRTRTTNTVSWSPPNWSNNENDLDTRTPSLNPIIQEIISRSGWTSGNDLTIMISDTVHNDKREADSEDGGVAPILHIEYTVSGCSPGVDSITITFTPEPTVNAGSDQSACENNPTVTLNGSITTATGGVWTGGNGVFSPDSATLNATYTPTAAELAAGSVSLTLTTTGNGGCNGVSDEMDITYTPAPTANAGPNQTICALGDTAQLAGSVTVATGGIWSGGLGTFIPSNTDLNAQYVPHSSEKSAGTVSLTLTTTGSGTCIEVTDQVTITIAPAPTSNAGIDQFKCSNNPNMTLNGSVTVATGGEWTGLGGGGFVPNNTTLNATYIPSASDISSNIAVLVLNTTGNGGCGAASDTMIAVISPAPTSNAGPDQSICENNPTITLSGSTTASSSTAWSGGAGSYSPNNTSLNTDYTPTSGEIGLGALTLYLTSSRASCNDVVDSIEITFTPAPTADAGPDQSVCYNNSDAVMNGAVTTATGGTWTGGTGTFSPDANSLNATYSPSVADSNGGGIDIILTTTGSGNCLEVSDTMFLEITPAPQVDAGADIFLCENNSSLTLGGSVTGAGGGIWSGNGIFAPGSNELLAFYAPSIGEILAGSAELILTTTGNANCNAESDTVELIFNASPVVDAGLNQTVCADNPDASLNGTVVGASGAIWSGGTGVFTPNNSTLNATYIPSASEITAGTVKLYLTTTGNGNCNPETDSMTITITPQPTINAGADQTVCGSTSSVPLNGVVTGVSGGQWSTLGSGNFNPSAILVSTDYQPSATDVSNDSVRLVLTTTGVGNCNVYTDTMTIFFEAAPVINAGPDQTVCSNDFPVALAANGSPGTWATSGSGTFSPSNSVHTATYLPSAADSTAGSVNLVFTTTATATCASITDDVDITLLPGPIVDAGPNDTICASIRTATLAGSFSNAGGIQWTSSGTGNFSNDLSTTSDYTASNADTTTGVINLILTSTGNGVCSAVTDTMQLVITPAVYANAGLDQTVCADASGVTLNGSIITADGGIWTGGNGSFSPNDSTLQGTYVPVPADTTAGVVTLILTSYGNGNCPGDADTIDITITPAPTANAGVNDTICADSNGLTLSGNVTVATGGQWSSLGTGTFTPSNAILNPTYEPSNADTTSGSVQLILTTTGNGDCNAVTDTMTLLITPIPEVNAGGAQTVCADTGTIGLNGIVNHATGGVWTSSGTGTFTPDNLTLNASYTLSSADSTGGLVTLTLTSSGNGTCNAVSDQSVVTVTPAPTANAGLDQLVCNSEDSVIVNGSVTIASGGVWGTTGSGTFGDSLQLSTFYTPSPADTTGGSVVLFLTTSGNGTCNPVTDSVTIDFSPIPNPDAGPNDTVCSDAFFTTLNGSVTNAGGLQWSTSGAGSFLPSNIDPGASYTFVNDTANGSVEIYLTTTSNGPCPAATDTMILVMTPKPTASAGADITVCADTSGVQLNGIITVASGGGWTSSGTGTFVPDTTDLNAIYIPSALDTAAGIVTITLTSTGNGLCNPVFDQMDINITPAPTANAGPNQTICADLNSVSLTGSVSTATGGQWSSTGTGFFSPNNTSLTTTYVHGVATDTMSLILTTTGNGDCKAVTDTMQLIVRPIPTVDAGANQTICNDGSGASLNGSISNATGGQWTTSGAGSFFPSSTALASTYDPDVTDTAVYLKLTTTGMGSCNAVSDSVLINIDPLPTLNAGANIEVCADADNVPLSAVFTNALGVEWSTSGSGIFDDSSSAATNYVPSAADKSAGSVSLTIFTKGTGTCDSISDNLIITFTPEPSANAGPDVSVCDSDDTLRLSGLVTNATGGFWDTDGSGTWSPRSDTTVTDYIVSAADKITGTVNFIFYATGAGSCLIKSDQKAVTFTSAPVIDAGGPADTVCADTTGFQLNATGSSGTWSGGAGTFSPNATTLNATYLPTVGELAAGDVTLTFTATNTGSCPVVNDTVRFNILPVPNANAGTDITVCSDTNSVPLSGSFANSTGVRWTTAGNGTFSDSSDVNAIYFPTSQDIADSNIVLTLTTTGNGICNADIDQMTLFLTPGVVANAGFDRTICADLDTISLNGSVKIATGGVWTTDGSGGFFPDSATLKGKYGLSLADQADTLINFYLTSTGNGSCNADVDTMQVTITPAPTIDAGPNDTICADDPEVFLNATVTVATDAFWVSSGSGTFSPSPFGLSPSYNATQADINSGSVTLYAFSTNNGTCNFVSDSLVVITQNTPIVDAGPNRVICANNTPAPLPGSVTNATGGYWTSTGTGTFSLDSTDLNASYQHTAADASNGGVTLILTSTGNGACNAVSDVMAITIEPAPVATVNAGLDQTICADKSSVDLQGFITIASGGVWRTLGSGTFSDTTTLSTTYTLSPADSASSLILITLTTTGNGICNSETDTMRVTVTRAPTIDAGPDQIICADSAYAQLDASVTVATGGIWTTTGSGSFSPHSGDTMARYTPSTTDISTGVIGLTVTSDGNGTCNAVSDNMKITITPKPTINAGLDKSICADESSLSLNGSVTVSGGGVWTTSGSGAFSDSSDLKATYTPTSADISAGAVNFILTTTNNGSCKAITDNVVATITPTPTVSAGSDRTSCANNQDVNLTGTVTVATGGSWSGGNGIFTPGPNNLTPTYTPSPGEINAGSAQLILRTTGNGRCQTYRDTVDITIVPSPIASADVLNICTDIGTVTELNGSVSNATGGIWSTSGTGQFTANTSDLTGDYTPSADDANNGFATLTLTTSGNGTCNAESDFITVLIKELPVANAGVDQTICRNGNATLIGQIFPNLSYEWYTNTGSSITMSPILSITANNDTSFVLQVTDWEGCQVEDTVEVFVIDPPVFNLNPQHCFSDSLVMYSFPSVIPAFGTFQWYGNNSFITDADSTVLLSDDIPTIGSYSVGYTYLGCSVFDTTTVTQPVAINDPSVIFCGHQDGTVELDAGPGTSYLWLGTGANSQYEYVDSEGYYNFYVYDANGCAVEDSIEVFDICPPNVYVPNAISPGAAQGSTLEIFGTDFTNFQIWIYNRWGEIIFYSNDETNEWDGTFNGSPMPPGVYQWRVEYEGLTDQFRGPYNQDGTVTIIR